jgi:polysaccharide export outer membrane protein
MTRHVAFWLGLTALMITSCIPNRKLSLLQDTEEGYSYNNAPEFSTLPGEGNYRLRPYDVLSIRLSHVPLAPETQGLDQSQMNSMQRIQNLNPYVEGYRINDSGYIQLPVLGSFRVASKTIAQVQDELQKEAATVYAEPSVKVFLLNYNITVLGDVRHPGRQAVYDHQINIFEAIGLAGGLDEFANRSEVKVIRTLPDQSTKVFHLNLLDKEVVQREGYFVKPNDVIFVKPLKRKAFSGKNIQWTISGLALVVSVIAIITR